MSRIVAFCFLSALAAAGAHAAPWRPAPGQAEIPIWPDTAPDANPDAKPDAKPEDSRHARDDSRTPVTDHLVAGKPWTAVLDVSRPTMTVYPPKGANSGVAVVVFPGGGYKILAIDLEGTEACDWLVSRGITCVLLKYRVPGSGPHWDSDCKCHLDPRAPTALEDAQRTVGLVRSRAAEWRIDPHKIGVLGFSAGGHLVADVSTHWDRRAYREVDAADRVSCRPDFGVAVYPGHLTEHTTRELELNPTIPVTSGTPPTFIVQAVDDPVDPVEDSLVYAIALKKAGVPVELHLFAHGGHAFGLRPTKQPITRWPRLVEAWLAASGFL